MCISDYRIGRLIRSQSDTYSVAAGSPQTIPAHRDRVGIYFATSTPILIVTSVVNINCNGVVIAKLWGAQTIQRLLLAEDGDLCTKEFTITAVGSTHVVGVHQLFLPEAAIAAALEEFKRSY